MSEFALPSCPESLCGTFLRRGGPVASEGSRLRCGVSIRSGPDGSSPGSGQFTSDNPSLTQ